MPSKVFVQPFEWQRIGTAMRITGKLIAEGLWTDMSSETVFYPRDVIRRAYKDILGKHIKFRHGVRAEDVVGFVTASRETPDGIEIEGIVFDKDVIDRIELGILNGLSMEADVDVKSEDKQLVATNLTLQAVALVESPACDVCTIETAVPIRLSSKEARQMSASEEKEGKTTMERRTREEFFNWLKDQMKAAGIPEDIIAKIISILEKAIKTPYPYPYPTPAKKAEEPTTETLMQRPTRAQFLRWLRRQLKEAGLDVEAVRKAMAVIKKAIKTPYPYPFPRRMEALEGDLRELEDLEKVIEEKDTKIKELESTINDLRERLSKYEQAEIDRLVEEIRKIDVDFSAEKLLEGIECMDAKKRILRTYLTVLQKRPPVKEEVKLSSTEPSNVEQKVTGIVSKMFGTTDLESIVKVGGEG